MKKITFSFVAALLLAASNLSAGASETAQNQELLAGSPALQQCAAQAYCPQRGRFVTCTVYADPVLGQSCTYETRYAYGVRCRGWDLLGRWVVFEDYCIY